LQELKKGHEVGAEGSSSLHKKDKEQQKKITNFQGREWPQAFY